MDIFIALLPRLLEGIGIPGLMFALCLLFIYKNKGFQDAIVVLKKEMKSHDDRAIANYRASMDQVQRNHEDNQKRFQGIEHKMETTIQKVNHLAEQSARHGGLLQHLIDDHNRGS